MWMQVQVFTCLADKICYLCQRKLLIDDILQTDRSYILVQSDSEVQNSLSIAAQFDDFMYGPYTGD